MTLSMLSTPFGDQPVTEVPLKPGHLVRVIAQLRFPQLASMLDDSVALSFVKGLSDSYPLVEEAHEITLTITGGAVDQKEIATPVWKLSSVDGAWQVALSKTSLTLESFSYGSRRDFLDRLRLLAELLIACARPPRFDRLGIRYINRIADEGFLRRVVEMVRPEILGVAAMQVPVGTELHHSMVDFQFSDPAGRTALVRSGVLPPGMTFDLGALPLLEKPSWVLDIDAAEQELGAVDADEIIERATHLTAIAYNYFRFSVTESFLAEFRE